MPPFRSPDPLDRAAGHRTAGQIIRQAREAKGWTMADLARVLWPGQRARYGVPNLSKWESDRQLPSIPNLRLLAETLGIEIHQLVPAARDLTVDSQGLTELRLPLWDAIAVLGFLEDAPPTLDSRRPKTTKRKGASVDAPAA